MKKVLITLICLMMLFSCVPAVSEENDEFLFRGNIKWGMSREEVADLEGEEYYVREIGISTGLFYENISISKYYGDLGYGFVNNRLVFCIYGLFIGREEFDYLKTALISVYGEEQDTSIDEFSEFILTIDPDIELPPNYSEFPICKWTAAEDTSIYLLQEDSCLEIYYISADYMNTDAETVDDGIDITGL